MGRDIDNKLEHLSKSYENSKQSDFQIKIC